MPTNFNQYQPYTGFNTVDPNTSITQDLGQRYITKSYLLDVYPNLVPGRTVPGLWSCGYNLYGELGLGDVVHRSSPVQVGSLTNWKLVASCDRHIVSVKTDGTLWSVGLNNNGGLGLGDVVNRTSPVQVGLLTNWKQVTGGGYHTVAISSNDLPD